VVDGQRVARSSTIITGHLMRWLRLERLFLARTQCWRRNHGTVPRDVQRLFL